MPRMGSSFGNFIAIQKFGKIFQLLKQDSLNLTFHILRWLAETGHGVIFQSSFPVLSGLAPGQVASGPTMVHGSSGVDGLRRSSTGSKNRNLPILIMGSNGIIYLNFWMGLESPTNNIQYIYMGVSETGVNPPSYGHVNRGKCRMMNEWRLVNGCTMDLRFLFFQTNPYLKHLGGSWRASIGFCVFFRFFFPKIHRNLPKCPDVPKF